MDKPNGKREKAANSAKQEARENAHQRPPMPPENELFYVSETKKIREARIRASKGRRNREEHSR